jgi:hypothetical protein
MTRIANIAETVASISIGVDAASQRSQTGLFFGVCCFWPSMEVRLIDRVATDAGHPNMIDSSNMTPVRLEQKQNRRMMP